MNSLKMALSTDDRSPATTEKPEVNGSLLRGVNRSKAEAVWALDVDSNDRVTEESLNTDNSMRILNELLGNTFRKDPKAISEVLFHPQRSLFSGLSRSFRIRQAAVGASWPICCSSRTS